jgi:hypothetical protein
VCERSIESFSPSEERMSARLISRRSMGAERTDARSIYAVGCRDKAQLHLLTLGQLPWGWNAHPKYICALSLYEALGFYVSGEKDIPFFLHVYFFAFIIILSGGAQFLCLFCRELFVKTHAIISSETNYYRLTHFFIILKQT